MTLGLLLATLLGSALTGSDASPVSLRVTAEPNHVVLRSGAPVSVTVTAELRDAQGEPVAHAALLSDATAGDISAFTEGKPGIYQATLSRPADNFPQTGVITIFVEPAKPGSPPLVGTALIQFAAEVNLRGTTEAGATMRVEVGDHTFGPAQVDPSGHFALPVVVPPGAGTARGISTDELGNASVSRINLYLPALDRLHSFVYPRTTVADGQTPAWIYVTCLSNSGAPQPGAVSARGTRGELGKPEALAVGLWRFAYVPPVAVAPGFDMVHLTGALEADEKIPLAPGPAARVTLTVAPMTAPADNHATAAASLLVLDAHDNPTDAEQVRIEVDGAPVDVTHAGVGAYNAIVPPRAHIGDGTVTATVWRPNNTPLPTVKQTITWRLPTPVTLALRVAERRAEGWVLHVDAEGDPDVASRLQWQASHGTVTRLPQGDWLLTATMPASGGIDVVALDARTGISAWLRIPVTP